MKRFKLFTPMLFVIMLIFQLQTFAQEADTLGRSFTTMLPVPEQVVLIYPEDEAIDVETNPVLEWQSVELADVYQLQVALDDSYTDFIVDIELANTQYQLSGLEYNTTYHWRVRAINDAGAGEWSGK